MFIIFFTFINKNSHAYNSICFQSNFSTKKSINLILNLPEDSSDTGSVRYKNGTYNIKIKRINEEILSKNKKTPAPTRSKFAEINEGKITGYYYLTSSGAAIGELLYIRKMDGKNFVFRDSQEDPKFNCSWEKSE